MTYTRLDDSDALDRGRIRHSRTVILVPRRGGDVYRERNWQAVRPHLDSLGYPLFVADSGDQPFSVARSYNQAAREAGDWDKAILWEADGWASADQVHRAVALTGRGMVYCFDHWVKLSRHGTRLFWSGQRDGFGPELLRKRQHPIPPPLGAGPRVVSRHLWESVGGFDERFVGWGPEDQDFAHRCERVFPHSRVEGKAYDLWHPIAPRDRLDQNRAILRENVG